MDRRLEGFLWSQEGVISRSQALRSGCDRAELQRLLRRRELVRLFRGVYLDHTGEPTWVQRAWGAVLAFGPAALWGPSALDTGGRTIHVAVDRKRSIAIRLPGVRVHYVTDLARRVRWAARPPRMNLAAATIDAAGIARDDLAALGVVARAVQQRQVTPAELLAELDLRGRTPKGAWIRSVLDDVAAGVCSVLEYGFRDRVLRRHGLPVGVLQQQDRLRSSVIYRDWVLDDLVIELDGRLHHDSGAAREADFDRDLETAAGGRQTVRISYGQVFARGCLTADALVRVFGHHAISTARRHPCCPGCPVR
jgi:hypothetical protein